MKIDLHVHSLFSDGGVYYPDEILELAAREGVTAFSFVEHDTLASLDEARRAAERLGIDYLAGIEIEARWLGAPGPGPVALHLLAYLFDETEPRVAAFVQRLVADFEHNVRAVIGEFHRRGADVSYDDLAHELAARRPGRPAPVPGRCAARRRLVELGLCEDGADAQARYIAIRERHPDIIPPPSAAEAVEAMKAGGAVMFLAHPAQYRIDEGPVTEEHLRALFDMGIDGVEIREWDDPASPYRVYEQTADRLGRPVTTGTDGHAPLSPGAALGVEVRRDIVAEMREWKEG